jgi:Carboxypeptidase regulatory-like domain
VIKRCSGFIPIFLFMVFACLARSPNTNPQDPKPLSQEPATKSVVRGRAVFEDTEQPAVRERIQLVSSEVLGSRHGKIPTSITDDNGEFVFRSVDAGEYYVVGHPADEHVPSAEAAPFPLWTGDAAEDAARLEQYKKEFIKITVDGRTAIRVDPRFRNPHFGAVAGHVVGSDGNPAAGAQVNLSTRSETRRSFGAHALTDDQGFYRFRGLPAGDYTVSANPPSADRDSRTARTGAEGSLGATYFPATIDPGNSPAVSVNADHETSDVNITLVARKLHAVSGAVMMQENGRPVASAMGRVFRRDNSGSDRVGGIESAMSNYFFTTDQNGHWSIGNLPDGTYLIQVTPALAAPDRDQKFVMKKQALTVAGTDLEDVLIEVSKGARISGTVTVEGDRSILSLSLLAAKIGQGSESSQTTSASVKPAGQSTTFLMTEVPDGEIQFSAFVRPDSLYIKSIDVNGVDLLREKLNIAPGSEVKEVRIVVSNEVATLEGRILSASGGPLAGVTVMLVPNNASAERRRVLGGRLTGLTNEQGAFSVTPPPGQYGIEVRRIDREAGAAKLSLENSPQITLQPGERKSMDIRMP